MRIIVDSMCDLPQEYLDKYSINVLPLKVNIDGVDYRDRVDINVEDVYSEMRKGILPKTSQVSPGDIYDLFNRYCEEEIDFIYIAFSSVLSGTCGLAQNISKEFKEKYPERKIEVIDSKAGSAGIGLIALQAAKMCEKGYDFEAVVNEINHMIDSIEHIFTLTDLNWLVKGGRLSKVEGAVGTLLDIKPILQVNNGYLEVIKKVRGRKKTLKLVIDLVEERYKNFPDQVIAVSHADDIESAEEIIGLLKERLGDKEIMITKIGCVLGAHLGIGGVGVLFFNKRPNIIVD